MAVTISGTNGIAVPLGSAAAPGVVNTTSATTGIYNPTSTTLGLSTNGTNAVYIDASQNVGIGTSSPTSSTGFTSLSINNATNGGRLDLYKAGSLFGVLYSSAANLFDIEAVGASTATRFNTNGAERMRIDSNGNVLVGTTVTNGTNTSGVAILNPATSTTISVGHATGTASGSSYYFMGYNGTNIGSISQSGTTAVAYNTSSDYRLKENVTPMTVGLATISALKPVTYDWVGTNENGEGFIAHELQEVIPHAVTGGKDAIDEDGKPIYQGVDYSKIVVHLVAAIQELSAKNDALEARLVALESK